MKKRVLVLGATGMLGSMVYDYLGKRTNFQLAGTSREKKNNKFKYFEILDFLKKESRYKFLRKYNYLINCTGLIKPYCKDNDPEGILNAIYINALFPYRLSKFLQKFKTKVLQIATDCVYSGKQGWYYEDIGHDALDVYGKTKSLGEVIAKNFLNIRCSIIGIEKDKNVSLLSWFLSQESGAHLKGFTHHKWNGVTTLQFAGLCKKIIENNTFNKLRKDSSVYHYLPNKAVNKFELLEIFKEVFNKDFIIDRVDNIGEPVDRTLSTRYFYLKPVNKIDMKKAIQEFKEYLDGN